VAAAAACLMFHDGACQQSDTYIQIELSDPLYVMLTKKKKPKNKKGQAGQTLLVVETSKPSRHSMYCKVHQVAHHTYAGGSASITYELVRLPSGWQLASHILGSSILDISTTTYSRLPVRGQRASPGSKEEPYLNLQAQNNEPKLDHSCCSTLVTRFAARVFSSGTGLPLQEPADLRFRQTIELATHGLRTHMLITTYDPAPSRVWFATIVSQRFDLDDKD